MNLKTKAFGLIAGTALSLSLLTGAMAAPGDTSVTLQNGDPCAASVSAGEITFGTWTWNGNSYVNSTAASGSVTVGVTNAEFGVTSCAVTLGVSNLTGAKGGSILSADITLTDGATSGTSYTVAQQSDLVVSAALSTNLTTVAPDTYTGDITVTSANAAA